MQGTLADDDHVTGFLITHDIFRPEIEDILALRVVDVVAIKGHLS